MRGVLILVRPLGPVESSLLPKLQIVSFYARAPADASGIGTAVESGIGSAGSAKPPRPLAAAVLRSCFY
jgi:hypothetical protein